MSHKASARIEPATKRDISVILGFIRDLAEYEKHLSYVTATAGRLERTLFGAEPRATVLLAYVGEQLVGFAVYYFTYSTFVALPGVYLEDLFVRPEARGKGVGRALLQRIAQIARENDCWRIEWSVLKWNEPAIRFYQNLGAVPTDEWAVYRLSGEALETLANTT